MEAVKTRKHKLVRSEWPRIRELGGRQSSVYGGKPAASFFAVDVRRRGHPGNRLYFKSLSEAQACAEQVSADPLKIQNYIKPPKGKKCSKCHASLPFEKFAKNQSEKDGHHRICKACVKKYITSPEVINRAVQLEREFKESPPPPEELRSVLQRLPIPIEAVPGIYFLFLRGRVQYVGKANSVYSRAMDHVKQHPHLFDEVWYEIIPRERLLAREGFWIKTLRPPLNGSLHRKSNKQQESPGKPLAIAAA